MSHAPSVRKPTRHVVVLCGGQAVGKSEASAFLAANFGFRVISRREIIETAIIPLYEQANSSHRYAKREKYYRATAWFRDHGGIEKLLLQALSTLTTQNVKIVVDSLRCLDELKSFEEVLTSTLQTVTHKA